MLKASDFDDAFHRALGEGLKDEKEYTNGDGERVVWRLASVISLDYVGEDLAHGQEVYSERVMVSEGQLVSFECKFHPETSVPTQTR